MLATLMTPEVLGALASLLVVVVTFLLNANTEKKTQIEKAKTIINRMNRNMQDARSSLRMRNMNDVKSLVDRQCVDIRAIMHVLSKEDNAD